MHDIDLSKYEIRTDMAVDLLDNTKENIDIDNYIYNGVRVSWMNLQDDNLLGKKKGIYLTMEFEDVTDTDYRKRVTKVFIDEFKKMLKLFNFSKNTKTLVIGLGNINSTPDSLGPKVSNNIIVTKHFFDMNIDVEESYSNVSSFYPGVTGVTGMETSDLILGVVKETKPDLVIIIDSLASTSITRVNKSIQVSDTGISPGSGIGNKRKEISKDTLKVPVIAVGVPTVVDASVIVCDTINYMTKNYVYNKKLADKKINKIITKQVNYLNKDISITQEDKKTLLGLVGTLKEDELGKLVSEVLTPIGYNLMVTPKEVDFILDKLSDLISDGINKSLHDI